MAKPRILIDTNILIDVLANRQPFVTEAKLLWDAHVDSKMDGYVAAVSLTDFFYIMRRWVSPKKKSGTGYVLSWTRFTFVKSMKWRCVMQPNCQGMTLRTMCKSPVQWHTNWMVLLPEMIKALNMPH